MGIFVKSMGFVLSLLPYSLLEFATELLGMVFVLCQANADAFFFKPQACLSPMESFEIKRSPVNLRQGCSKWVFFSGLSLPFSKEKLKRTVLYSSEVENQLEKYRRRQADAYSFAPLCLFETLATSPYFRPKGGKSLGAVYRPNRNPELDRWINKARLKPESLRFARKQVC